MKRNRTVSGVLAATAVLVGLGVGSSVAIAAGEGPPPPPPWVNSDGTVDESKIPEFAPGLDRNGKVIRDEKGRPVQFKVDMGPPPPGPAQPGNRGNEISREKSGDREVVTVRPNVLAPGQNK